MAFDLEAAKKEGYSDDEIADYLASQRKFDLAGARAEGYSSTDIIGHLTKADSRTWGQAAKDTVLSLGSGASGVVKNVGNLVGMIPGNGADNILVEVGKRGQDFYNEDKSPYLKEQSAKRSEAIKKEDGILSQAGTAIKETVSNPALAGEFFTEQLPQLVGPAAAARVAGVGGAILTGAGLQGADIGGEAYDNAYKSAIAQGMTVEQAKEVALDVGRKATAASAGISVLANKLPGGSTIERALAGKAVAGSMPAGIAKGAIGEGISEAIEEGGGKTFGNIAEMAVNPDKKLSDDVGESLGMGALGGVGMGGVAGGFHRKKSAPKEVPAKSVDPILAAQPTPGKTAVDNAITEAFKSAGIRDIQDQAIALDDVGLADAVPASNVPNVQQPATSTATTEPVQQAPVFTKAEQAPIVDTPAMAQMPANDAISATSDIPNVGTTEPNLGVTSADGQPETVATTGKPLPSIEGSSVRSGASDIGRPGNDVLVRGSVREGVQVSGPDVSTVPTPTGQVDAAINGRTTPSTTSTPREGGAGNSAAGRPQPTAGNSIARTGSEAATAPDSASRNGRTAEYPISTTQPTGEVNGQSGIRADLGVPESTANGNVNRSDRPADNGVGSQAETRGTAQDRRTQSRATFDPEVAAALTKANELAKVASKPDATKEQIAAASKAINDAEDLRESRQLAGEVSKNPPEFTDYAERKGKAKGEIKTFKSEGAAKLYSQKNRIRGFTPRQTPDGWLLSKPYKARSAKQQANDARLKSKREPIDVLRDDLIQAVRKKGGIDIADAIANGIDPKDIELANKAGFKKVFRKGGMSMDEARESFAQSSEEAGYLDPNQADDLNHFIDRLTESVQGQATYYSFAGQEHQQRMSEEAREADQVKHDLQLNESAQAETGIDSLAKQEQNEVQKAWAKIDEELINRYYAEKVLDEIEAAETQRALEQQDEVKAFAERQAATENSEGSPVDGTGNTQDDRGDVTPSERNRDEGDPTKTGQGASAVDRTDKESLPVAPQTPADAGVLVSGMSDGKMAQLRRLGEPARDIKKEPTGWKLFTNQDEIALVHPDKNEIRRFDYEPGSGTDRQRSIARALSYAQDNPIAAKELPKGELEIKPIFQPKQDSASALMEAATAIKEAAAALTLATQSREELQAKKDTEEKAAADKAAELKKAEEKAQADKEPFNLTGSDRSADVLAAAGQKPLFARPIEAVTRSENFKKWSHDAPLVRAREGMNYDFKTGEKVVVEAFHGTGRPDRVGNIFKRSRATSGPMAFFTNTPELGSGYAEGKQDTSLADENQNYENWFKFKAQGERSSRTIDRAWYALTSEQREKISALAPRVMFDEDGDQVILGPEDHTSGTGGYDQHLKETRSTYQREGNPLKALVEEWLSSGNLYNREEQFMDVLKLAGMPMQDVTYDSPHARYPFVFHGHVAMLNPLVTNDVPQNVVTALDAAAKSDRTRATQGFGADPWDKTTRTVKDWVAEFHGDSSEHVWTSIPDKVTAVFERMGYDGIIDVGGKNGGPKHIVLIPFQSSQFKAIGNKGTYSSDSQNMMLSRAGKNTQRIATTDAKAAVSVITKRWENGPPINVHEDFTSAPQGLQDAIAEATKGDQAKGAWYAGEVHLFTQNIENVEQLERTILHEARHYGLQGLFGKDMNPILMEIYMKDKGVREAAQKVAKEFQLSNVDAVNEVLADMPLDAAKQLSGWTKLVAKLKAWLEQNGFTNLAKLLSSPEADAITKDILYQVEQFVKTGKRSDTTLTTTLFHRAFHGSPHDFDQFTTEKMGTGEGAQAYGWGLYFAGNKEVANHYRGSLSYNSLIQKMQDLYDEGYDPHEAASLVTVDDSITPKERALLEALEKDDWFGFDYPHQAVRSAFKEIENFDPSPETRAAVKALGQVYEVELAPKDEDYLDWDKPMGEQSAKVKAALASADFSSDAVIPAWQKNGSWDHVSGQSLYRHLAGGLTRGAAADGKHREASLYLKSIGIPGIRYLDGSSRSKGEGHHNYVIFDDKDVNVVAKFSRAPGGLITKEAAGSWGAPTPSKMDSIIYKLQDKQIDMKRVVQSVRDFAGEISETWNAYLKEEMFHGRSAKRVQNFVNTELKPLLTDMQMRGVEMKDFETYLHNRHAEERNKQVAKINPKLPDRGSGIKTKDAREYLKNLSEKDKRNYEALAKKVDAISAGTRQTLQDYGLMSTAEMAQWEGAYKHYVPLMKDTEVTGQGEGFSIRGPESQRAIGDGAIDSNILANLVTQRERAIVRGEKNRVALSLYGLAKLNPNKDFWTVDDPPILRRVVKLSDATDRKTIPLGFNIPENATEVVVEGPDPQYMKRDNVVVTKYYNPKTDTVTEKAIVFNEDNPRALRMAMAMKNLDADQLGEIMGLMAKGTRFLAAVNTQYNPIFGAVNLARDVQGAVLNLSSTPLAGKQKAVMAKTLSALKGVYLTERSKRDGKAPKGEWGTLWDEFQEVGGQTGYRDLFANSQDRADKLQSEINQITEGKLKHAGRAMFDWLSDYNQSMENSVRLAAYKVGLDQGLSKEKAASIAKNLTVNFNRKGQITQQAGALYAFFNASVQGTARLAETMKGPAGKKILIGGLLLGVMQAFALAGFDEDEPPQFEREKNLIIPIGGKDYIKIPMPLGLHIIPNIGRIFTEMGLHGKPMERFTQLFSVAVDAFNPTGQVGISAQTFAPTLADPLVALGENRDWMGKPIAREDFSSLNPTPGHTRAKDTATIYSKALSEGLNWISGGTEFSKGKISPTPDQLDYLIGQVTGGVGREASKVQQSISAMFTGEELPPYKIPLLGRFYGSTGSQASKASLFYRNLKELNAHEAEIEGRQKKGEDPSDYIRDHPDSEMYEAANRVERDISKMMKAKRQMVKEDAPKADIKEIEAAMADKMHEFNTAVRALRGKPALQ